MAQQPVTKAPGTRAPARTSGDPFTAFRREMDRMFEDFLSGFGMPMMRQAGTWEGGVLAPRIETSETDEEISVSAELPGIDEEDIDVTLSGDVLTIRARKEAEREEDDEDRDYHLTERSYGTSSVRFACRSRSIRRAPRHRSKMACSRSRSRSRGRAKGCTGSK